MLGAAPEVPSTLAPFVRLESGAEHLCGVTRDGTLQCWGMNDYGQIAVPSDLTMVREVAMGDSHTRALHGDDDVTCWGQISPLPAELSDTYLLTAGSVPGIKQRG